MTHLQQQIKTAPPAPDEPRLDTYSRTRAAMYYTDQLLRHFDLSHWTVTLDRALRRMGICRYLHKSAAKTQTIGLSRWILDARPQTGLPVPWDAVIDTVRHEKNLGFITQNRCGSIESTESIA